MLCAVDISALFNSTTELVFGIATLLGAIATFISVLGYKKKGKKLKEASEAIEDATKKVAEMEDVLKTVVKGVEEIEAPQAKKRAKKSVSDVSKRLGTEEITDKAVQERI